MKWLRFRSSLFVVMSVLTAIPVFLLGSRQAAHFAEEVQRSHDESLVIASRGVRQQLQQLIESRISDLEGLAGVVQMLGSLAEPRLQSLLLQHSAMSEYYQGMYIADADANVVVRVPLFAPGQLPSAANNYSDRDYYRKLVAERRTAVASAHVGKALGRPGIQVASPIFSPTEELIGYIEGSVALEPIARLVESYVDELPAVRVLIWDNQSTLIADSSPHHELLQVSTIRSVERAGLRLGNTNGYRYHLEGEVTSLPGWSVVASLPQAGVDAIAARGRRQVWIVSAIVWLFSTALAGLFSHGFGTRFSELAATAQALGDGQFSRRPMPQRPWEPVEVGILVQQMNGMAARLERQTQELERLVEERTGELANVNARLEVLVNALERAEDGIEISDPKGCYIYVNPALEKITGFSSQELLGQSSNVLRSGHYDEAFYANIERNVHGGNVFSGAFTGKRKDGTIFDQEVTIWPVVNAVGVLTHVVGLRRDVTERRKTEQALRVSERMASVGTLAAGVAHEVNNPLTYVLLSLRVVERELLKANALLPVSFLEKTSSMVEHAIEGAERVQAIVQDLRSFSRAGEEKLETLELRAVLESALRMAANNIRHRAKLTYEWNSTPLVYGSGSRLSQVFLNLLVNSSHALEAGDPSRDEIRILTFTDDQGYAVVQISDTGVGIAPEHIGRIFDPFFTTKPIGEGTGLGLSVCHNIVRDMNGQIRASSTLGTGSTFTIRLPPAPSSKQLESIPVSEQGVERGARSKVLLIDDDRAVAKAVKAVLERHLVSVVHDAASALIALEGADFDVIFCDVMMPGVGGLMLYEEIRKRGGGEEERIVFITGGGLSEATREQLERTQRLCLDKPLSENDLERAIAMYAKKRRAVTVNQRERLLIS